MRPHPAAGQLPVKAWDTGLCFLSFTSVYCIMRSAGMMSMRGAHGPHDGRSLPPERKELTGPNQRWCRDISYLKTFEKGLYLYLYLLLDEYSRKAVQRLVSRHQNALEARRFIEEGLISENILDLRQAAGYFERYFSWYNDEHLHSRMDFVTPNQCHQGLREKIVAYRRARLKQHRRLRKEVNRSNHITAQQEINPFLTLYQPSPCSVINS